MAMRFPAKRNAGCPKAPRDFPPRKDGIFLPLLGCFWALLPLPQSLYPQTDGWTYADVRTKVSRIDRLPDFLTQRAPLRVQGLRYEGL